ncbi:PhnD/SsuA/transferrin family substrate-binding protein [Vitreoscilla massiliensis]|uniref:histidine kinase n=1 Tax=Vitreoscilla massiliensis TaxID=1689272 RepID=A0ABY4DWV5_9NEIS|nr:PhnD/SsuA/transferrin family substrate-binding protein [Vitreoscilla massiliensis]UOO87782.1 PhnD/SsuA/transferrin family substrate-binding protein [Vitreoscilla massiliensis]
MKFWHIINIFIIVCSLCFAPVQAATWLIGIQAPNGASATQEQWQAWVDWLSAQMPDDDFSLVALNTADFKNSLHSHKLDFVIAQPVQLLLLPKQMPTHWLASVASTPAQGINGAEVGSAIWVRQDSPLHTLKDLHGKRVAAVSPHTFGGYLAAMPILQAHGVHESDLHMQFSEYPIARTLEWLQAGRVDAAITPLCLMEQLQQTGHIDRRQFRLLSPAIHSSHCQGHVEFASNWLLAAMPDTPTALSNAVARAVLSADTPADLPQWQSPQSTHAIEQVLLQTGHHPYQQNLWQSLWFYGQKYRYWSMTFVVVLLLLLGNHGVAIYLAKRRQHQLQQMYHKLLQTEKMMYHSDRIHTLGEMMSGIGHELNQPLTAIQYYADGVRLKQQAGRLQADDLPTALQHISQQVEHSRSIIHNIRAWAKMPPSQPHTSLSVAAILAEVRQFIAWQHPDLALHISCDSALTVLADAIQLQQILVNAILNSQQAGASHIHMQGLTGRLVLHDNGPGFTDAQLAFPFVPFRTSRSDGLGIGLVVCARLARSMNMNLTLSNHADGGAVVTLEWPAT